jgi:transcription-repair coupling factor (superfamily II helicase)
MNLAGILPLIEDALDGGRLKSLPVAATPSTVGLPDGAKACFIAALVRQMEGPLLVVTSRPHRALALGEELAAWLGSDEPIRLFPPRDALPYERLAPDWAAVRDRLRLLSLLTDGAAEPLIVVASVQALSQTLLSPDEMRSARETLTVGGELPPDAFLRRLAQRGFRFEPLVDLPGQASRRGGIIDLFSPDADLPLRIELLGDRVESIRLFDPETQRTIRLVESATVGPAREMLLPQPGARDLLAQLDLTACPLEVGRRFQEELSALASGEGSADDTFYLPFLTRSTILDFLPGDALLILDEMSDIAIAQEEHDQQVTEARDEMIAQGELPPGMPLPHLPESHIRDTLHGRSPRLDLSRFASGEEGEGFRRLPFAPTESYGGRLPELAADITDALRHRETVVIVSQQAARLAEVLGENDLFVTPSDVVETPPPPGGLALVHGSLPHGWRLPRRDGALALLTDAEIFGFVKQRRLTRPPSAARREAFLSEVDVGDLVVHVEHGIGRFAGLIRRSADGHEREYMEVRYAEGDRLFVPTDQVDRVSRYVGPSDRAPSLTRLGSQEWPRAKARVRRAVAELARELLELYASRQVLEGHAFPPDMPWQQELEASFPYVETPDQLAVMWEVKSDMESPRPMDRLVCGDVGYGKTEVAIRAAFKAVMDGMQVAMLVPTTVLAQQHYQTFRERLAGFPVHVEMLSRFRSPPEQREIVGELASGAVDIVIGTHRLLQRDITFKNLGLVIIDEEQRFGVSHKERLKQMRQEVDVLTLSATPIPRTLHMSLAGIRDMSTMETPPEERLPIKTYVMEYDGRLVREAVLRELERGGQVYFVHNRVQNIEVVARKLTDLVPEATIAVAHGQMPEEQLAGVMFDFVKGVVDVLVCTTIIESGLDIANVNTIIINQANKLGLAQLYQLRGRVGRGVSRAYAYLLYERGRSLTEPAQRRIQAIFEATELGAGFQIALRDLEIRGAGNLLGAEQSGQIGAVGFDLYSRLLADAVERLKALQRGEKPPPPSEAVAPLTIDLPLTAHIPDSYVGDINLRLALYQRLAAVQRGEEIEALAREMKDRFGRLPRTVRTLLYVVRLRTLAREAGLQSIQTEDREIVLRMAAGKRLPQEKTRREIPPETWVGPTSVRLSRSRLGECWQEALLALVERLAVEVAAEPAPGR